MVEGWSMVHRETSTTVGLLLTTTQASVRANITTSTTDNRDTLLVDAEYQQQEPSLGESINEVVLGLWLILIASTIIATCDNISCRYSRR